MALEQVQVETLVRSSPLAKALSRWAGAVVAVVQPEAAQVIPLGRGVAADTPVQIASVTKAFTGLLLADAVLRGELSLQATVEELLLGQPAKDSSITVQSLATHTSGLPRLSIGARVLAPDPYRGYTRAHLLQYLAKARPQLPATRSYRYSNLGFAVLGLMLEQACGATYAELLQERVLAPLGLRHTQLALAGQRLAVRRGYAKLGKSPLWLGPRPPVWYHDAYAPCGALVSTASELVVLAQRLLDAGGPLAEAFQLARGEQAAMNLQVIAARKLMKFQLARGEQAAIPGGAIGLAWHLPGSRRFAWHNGSTFGHSAYVAVAPQYGVAVVAVANQPLAAPMTLLGHALMKQALMKQALA